MRGVISRVAILITHIRGLVTLLITTHEPPSTPPERFVGAHTTTKVQRPVAPRRASRRGSPQ